MYDLGLSPDPASVIDCLPVCDPSLSLNPASATGCLPVYDSGLAPDHISSSSRLYMTLAQLPDHVFLPSTAPSMHGCRTSFGCIGHHLCCPGLWHPSYPGLNTPVSTSRCVWTRAGREALLSLWSPTRYVTHPYPLGFGLQQPCCQSHQP